MKKVYQVSLDKPVTMEHLQQIADGIELEDGRIVADAISYISHEEKNEIGIEIHSGRNRIVRRIFEHFGYRVKKLDRVTYAGLTKKNLPRGKYRFLTDKEIQYLKMQ
jgi:23S rRNA pseudouridine2605 synthase